MSRTAAIVLWEDARGPINEFGPHALALACLGDRVRSDHWELRSRIRGIPKKGASKLVAAYRNDHDLLAPAGEALIAVLDHDRAGEQLGLATASCKTAILSKIREGTSPTHRGRVVLLESNVETVVRAAAKELRSHQRLVVAACDRKDINARDQILLAAAAPECPLRAKILASVPSFERLVDLLERALNDTQPPVA